MAPTRDSGVRRLLRAGIAAVVLGILLLYKLDQFDVFPSPFESRSPVASTSSIGTNDSLIPTLHEHDVVPPRDFDGVHSIKSPDDSPASFTGVFPRNHFSIKDDDEGRKKVTYVKAICRAFPMIYGLSQQFIPDNYRTRFTDPAALDEFGYIVEAQDDHNAVALSSFDVICTQLGLVPTGEWTLMEARTGPDSKDLIEGDVIYIMAFDPSCQAIINMFRFGPEKLQPDALTRVSDITWFMWQQHCQKLDLPPSGLKHFLIGAIINDDTNAIIDRILKSAGKILNPWPGLKFTMDKLDGQALLGTPNAVSLGWLLWQHMSDFPEKTVESAAIFGTRYAETTKLIQNLYLSIGQVDMDVQSRAMDSYDRFLKGELGGERNERPPAGFNISD